jgi:hypothetical protein
MFITKGLLAHSNSLICLTIRLVYLFDRKNHIIGLENQNCSLFSDNKQLENDIFAHIVKEDFK